MFFDCPFSFLQLPVRIPPTSLQALPRKEFDDKWEESSSDLSAIRTHLIRGSGDSSSMFVVFGFDLIFKVWFMCIGLTSDILGFS